jgi:hypothetical protein
LPRPTRPLADYAGSYQLRSPSIEFTRFHSDVYKGIQVQARAEGLWLAFPDRPGRLLIPSGRDQFRHRLQSGSAVQFIRDAAGRRAVIVGQAYYEEERAWWAWARKAALELSLLLMMSTICVPVLLALGGSRAEAQLLIRPFLAGLCLLAMSMAFDRARGQGQLGELTGSTLLVWGLSWIFAWVSYSGFSAILRSEHERVHAALRTYAWLAAGAAVWIALHLSRYGLIGIRTWRW